MSRTAECSELRNAERLIEAHSADIRYADGIGWLCWDGRRFAPDLGALIELCKEVLRALYSEATIAVSVAREELKIAKGGGEEQEAQARGILGAAQAYAGWLARSKSKTGIANMLDLASTDSRVRIAPEALDANSERLCVQNGTIDLRSGLLLGHSREDLITRLSPVAYEPEVNMDAWLNFVEASAAQDAEMVEEMRLLAGYTAIGGPNVENVFVFVLGNPGSGKGTFVDSVRGVLGREYSSVVRFSMFLKQKTPQEIRPDKIFGKRMISSAEADEKDRIDEGTLSNMSGGDEISTRALFKESFDFIPCCTIWLQCNNPPAINMDANATGVPRRIRTLWFRNVVPAGSANKNIKAYHTDPKLGGPAVLRWIVSGAMSYLAEGKLPMSAASRERKEELRKTNDPIAGFAEQCLIFAPEEYRKACPNEEAFREWCTVECFWALKRDIRTRYEAYCTEEGIRAPMSPQAFKKAISSPAYGCHEKHRHASNAAAWWGVRTRTERDDIVGPAQGAPANDWEHSAAQ